MFRSARSRSITSAYRRLKRVPGRSRRFADRPPTVPSPLVESPLVESAERAGAKMTKANKAFLRALDERLRRRERPVVAILVGSRPSRLTEMVTEAHPGSRVFRYDVATGVSPLHAGLAAHGPFDLIVDDTRQKRGRVRLFRNVFFHLRPGGAFIVRNVRAQEKATEARPSDEGLLQLVSRLVEIKGREDSAPSGRTEEDEQKLAAAVGRVVLRRQHLLVTNQGSALAKMSEAEMDTVLELRGEESGRVVESRPSLEFRSRCTLRENTSELSIDMAPVAGIYRVPAMSLREYHDVVCAPGQVAIQGNLLLPDTYRHNQRKRLKNLYTVELSRRFAMPKHDVSPAESLAGAYFYLDSEFRGHFGHAITEQMSRLWAWPHAKRAEPGLKAVMALNKDRELAKFEIALYGAAGIDPSDLVLVRGPVKVQRLLAATPMLSNPDYVHPDIRETWAKVGRSLASSAPARDYPRRIFCSRRTSKRACHNAAEVESLFSNHGFEVVYPEDFPLAEQAMIFRQAEVVAGFAGSGLFSLCFCESPKRVVMISSESYMARNEYLIASVLGHEIDVVWCKADIPRPENGWDKRSTESGFIFDPDREGVYLKAVLASL